MRIRYIATTALLALAPSLAHTQMTGSSRIYGDADHDIPTPTHSVRNASDSTAIQLMVTFIRSTGLVGWSGMTANGSITFANDPIPHTARLSLLGGTQGRLDVSLNTGTQSTILNGAQGVFLDANGTRFFLSSDIAVAGLVAFPRFLATGYPASTSVVTDRGTTTIAGTALRRITLDDPSPDGTGSSWKTEDLYFDPTSGNLVESVAPIHLSTLDPTLYMLETNYTNYQNLGGGSVATAPFTISQYLNGQLQWTLILSDASTELLPPASSFNF